MHNCLDLLIGESRSSSRWVRPSPYTQIPLGKVRIHHFSLRYGFISKICNTKLLISKKVSLNWKICCGLYMLIVQNAKVQEQNGQRLESHIQISTHHCANRLKKKAKRNKKKRKCNSHM